MKRVYSSLNSLLVDNLCNVLEQEGVRCEVRNRHGSSMVGCIPVTEAWVELWVDDDQVELATRRIEQEVGDQPSAKDRAWRCPQCDNEVDAGFDTCWYCAGANSTAEHVDRARVDDQSPIIASAEFDLRTFLSKYGWYIALGLLLLYGAARLRPW